MSPSIIFTGGGTAGHVTPNIALIKEFKQDGWEVAYIGSSDGIEKSMIEDLGIPFHAVSSGKLRRYYSFKNFLDPFKIILGIFQCFFLFMKLKPDAVFSKGGFVAFPVVVGAFLNRIPVVAHESDISPGLATKLCFPFVKKICLTFEAGKKHFKNLQKIEVTGTPIRDQLFSGNAAKGLKICSFNNDKPCLLVIGGSLGAGSINQCIRENIKELTKKYQIMHICGKGKLDPALMGLEGYHQFEYVHEELGDLFAAASIIISRSGANSLYEILALGKAHILIPLSAKVSRGDQIENAEYFRKMGISLVIDDEALNRETLFTALEEVEQNKAEIEIKIKALSINSAVERIVAIIKEQANVQSPRTV